VAESVIGYYNLQNNRMAMCDLTGAEASGSTQGRLSLGALTDLVLSQPGAERTVATIVHEATHQIAFNCGLHVRYSDCPLWVSEGIAMYFETPDLRSAKGWRTIGAVSHTRLTRLGQYLQRRPPDSLATLIQSDDRFRDPEQGLDAYAEAWALTYFLIRTQPDRYVAYVRELAGKKPLLRDAPQERLDLFQSHFGDLAEVDAELLRYVRRIR
jgi:hypothetical protein